MRPPKGRRLRAERSPRSRAVVAAETAQRAVRSGLVWGYIFAVVVASSALTYTRFYPTQADRDRLAATFGSNHASSALFGPAPRLETAAGFTVFKTSMTLMLAGAVWGLLTSTRLLRGEEDTGRWEVLLSGQTTRRRAAGEALGGLAAGVATVWAITAVVAVLIGTSSKVSIGFGAALYFALALVASAVMFLAVGAVTSQLAAPRRRAAGLAAVFLGISYGLRMVADSGVGLHWLVWTSPLGWVEQLRPLTSPQPWALLPIGVATGVLAVAAVQLADRRDVGASTLPDRDHARARLRLLSGPTGLTIRLVRGTVAAWAIAIAAAALLMGVVAKAAGSTISGSSVQQVFSRLGASGAGAKAYLGVTFLILAVLLGFVAAGQVTAARSEEAAGRLDHLLVRSVSRWSWLAGRLLVAVDVLIAGGLIAGLFSWIGAATQHSVVGLPTLLGAGINIVPPAIFVLGVGAATIGIWPRAAVHCRLRPAGLVPACRVRRRFHRARAVGAGHVHLPPHGLGAGRLAGLDGQRHHGRFGSPRHGSRGHHLQPARSPGGMSRCRLVTAICRPSVGRPVPARRPSGPGLLDLARQEWARAGEAGRSRPRAVGYCVDINGPDRPDVAPLCPVRAELGRRRLGAGFEAWWAPHGDGRRRDRAATIEARASHWKRQFGVDNARPDPSAHQVALGAGGGRGLAPV